MEKTRSQVEIQKLWKEKNPIGRGKHTVTTVNQKIINIIETKDKSRKIIYINNKLLRDTQHQKL